MYRCTISQSNNENMTDISRQQLFTYMVQTLLQDHIFNEWIKCFFNVSTLFWLTLKNFNHPFGISKIKKKFWKKKQKNIQLPFPLPLWMILWALCGLAACWGCWFIGVLWTSVQWTIGISSSLRPLLLWGRTSLPYAPLHWGHPSIHFSLSLSVTLFCSEVVISHSHTLSILSLFSSLLFPSLSLSSAVVITCSLSLSLIHWHSHTISPITPSILLSLSFTCTLSFSTSLTFSLTHVLYRSLSRWHINELQRQQQHPADSCSHDLNVIESVTEE